MSDDKPYTFSEVMRIYQQLLSEEEFNTLLQWEEFHLKIEKNARTLEEAQKTFSKEALAGVIASFHIWMMGRIQA